MIVHPSRKSWIEETGQLARQSRHGWALNTCVSGWKAYQANQKAIRDGIGWPSALVTEALWVCGLKWIRTV